MSGDGASIVFCPACSARYSVEEALLDVPRVVVLCGTCGAAFEGDRLRAEAAGADADAAPADKRRLATVDGVRVVVGHEVPSATRTIVRVLVNEGFAPVAVRSGEQVLQACDPALPARAEAVVLDVGIPGVMAFEVIEQLRAHPLTQDMPVVLLASVFEKTRYKRRPNQLYGADAYLELHHVPDRLGTILKALLEKRPMPSDQLQAPADRAKAAPLRGRPSTLDDAGLRTLARRLLSDVALYYGDEVAAGVAAGDPFLHVGDAVEAARQLFEQAAEGRRADLFEEELEDFVGRLRERRRARGMADG